MAWRWKRIELPHPAAVVAAGGILLFGAHLHQQVRAAAVARVAPPAASAGPVVAALPVLPPSPWPDLPPVRNESPPAAPTAGPPAPTYPPPPPARRLAPRIIGPEAPVRGPQWKGGALPAFDPEVLRAMMDPRAARRAQRLRRLGVVPPNETPPAVGPVVPGKLLASRPELAAGLTTGPLSRGQVVPSPAGGVAPAAGSERAGGSGRTLAPAEGVPAARGGKLGPASSAAGSGVAAGSQKPAPPDRAPGSKAEPASRDADGATEQGTASAADAGPIRLQAKLDRPRPEYHAGEWVALRFLASHPAHLRVYRVDATGHVTRLFSTYDRDDSSRPARAFSMMVKAGQPRPGQERVVAIGSARPLTRDELLDCLRSYVAEGPVENPTPAPATADSGAATGARAAPLPLAEALRAVMDTVGRTGDLPAGAAGLARASWSVAVGRFISSPKSYQQSAVSDPLKRLPSAPTQDRG